MSKILEEYFNPKALELAYKRVYSSFDNNEIKIIAHQNFGLKNFIKKDYKDRCKQLSESILEGNYKPSQGFKYYRPKASKTQRTITELNIFDAIVYQALVNRIAEVNYSALEKYKDFAFGNFVSYEVAKGVDILNEKKQRTNYPFFESWQKKRKEYNECIAYKIKKCKTRYTLETDITGFYDSIPHSILKKVLNEKWDVDIEITEFITDVLNIWSGTKDCSTPGVGIPQGPLASSFFANIILHELDDQIIQRSYKGYFRYVDDIFIIGDDESDLYDALVTIDRYTKSMALSINSTKTNFEIIDENKIKEKEDYAKKINLLDKINIYADEEVINLSLGKNKIGLDEIIDSLFKLCELGNTTDNNLENEIIEKWFEYISSLYRNNDEKVSNVGSDMLGAFDSIDNYNDNRIHNVM